MSQSPDDRVAKKQATCVIVEDEIDIREMFCDFAKHAGLRVIGNAGDGREAMEVIRQGRPDLVVTDLRLPFLTGPEIIATVRREIPDTKFIAITGHHSVDLFRQTAGAGADAYLFKPVCLPEFSAAVVEVLAGWPHLSKPAFKLVWDTFVARQSASPARDLTRRQREVIGLVAEGCTNKEISVRLSIAVRTVEKHRREGSECIGARCTADLVRYALDSGLSSSFFHTFSK